MFYSFIRYVAAGILWLINGRYKLLGTDKLPTGNYILVGPHRTWWEPIFFALAGWPHRFSFMAKKELFKNPILRWILIHANAFSVDRDHPGPSAIKTPVQNLKKTDLSLIMFPSGSRHSEEMKGGALIIAKLSGVPLVPIVYQGPVKFSGLFKRKNVTMAFGDPIYIDKRTKINEETTSEFGNTLQASFDKLDQEIDPNWVYIDPKPKKKNNNEI
ncbi:lysophospholipid acyltransferase family protein [Weissella hellenica]|uniref:1-acyl-sn-glycerol-3-phosphate acyltransferase n=1 Tax=Weissella hellenica TaxID=46256 RepID=A0A4Y4G1V6_WEIHE|nr:1-acyl-sn-glycerol-3-phosphate acyltransferase [Weissella hellenica]NKY67387.1 1-acyl-sn-glycerol-3-phosphate acyltransferase [Weissella hellenica]GED36372.1 1-acyl-sn-glycerol-3-phosphate acyltransferase [Weissella hellenica]SCC04852.1 1-acyl-sn-glycerol-3-phosphate acyltransferase [Weissella hellenica]